MSNENVKNYTEQGGERTVIGGSIDVVSGAEVDIESGGAFKIAGVDLTDEVAQLANTDRALLIERVALTAADTAGGLFAWTPGFACLVERVLLDVTTKATGACTADIGVAANATTLNDTLLDGVDVGTAAGLFDNIENKGTNGKARQKVTSTQSVTGSVASGASAGIVGFAYIHYVKV